MTALSLKLCFIGIGVLLEQRVKNLERNLDFLNLMQNFLNQVST